MITLISYGIGKIDRKAKNLFVVSNRNFTEGYYNCEKTAERRAAEINLMVGEHGEKSYIDKSPYFVREIETTD